MTRTSIAPLVLAFIAVVAFTIFAVMRASAAPDNLPPGANSNVMRPCNIDGATLQNVSVSATSAPTTNAVAVGKIRVICTQVSYMTSGASPVATTSHVYLPASVPMEFYSYAVKYAFIRASADGVCQVLECK